MGSVRCGSSKLGFERVGAFIIGLGLVGGRVCVWTKEPHGGGQARVCSRSRTDNTMRQRWHRNCRQQRSSTVDALSFMRTPPPSHRDRALLKQCDKNPLQRGPGNGFLARRCCVEGGILSSEPSLDSSIRLVKRLDLSTEVRHPEVSLQP